MEKIMLQHAILEALYMREFKPGLNTQDELRDHKLIVKVTMFACISSIWTLRLYQLHQ